MEPVLYACETLIFSPRKETGFIVFKKEVLG
jgi:hypothetical protein